MRVGKYQNATHSGAIYELSVFELCSISCFVGPTQILDRWLILNQALFTGATHGFLDLKLHARSASAGADGKRVFG
jgi:hypothetical protein